MKTFPPASMPMKSLAFKLPPKRRFVGQMEQIDGYVSQWQRALAGERMAFLPYNAIRGLPAPYIAHSDRLFGNFRGI